MSSADSLQFCNQNFWWDVLERLMVERGETLFVPHRTNASCVSLLPYFGKGKKSGEKLYIYIIFDTKVKSKKYFTKIYEQI